MAIFKHSGKLGDIIWSLPFVRSVGGGDIYLELGVMEAGAPRLDLAAFESIKPFLELQPYIGKVGVFNGGKVDYDLDQFRGVLPSLHGSLVDSYYIAFDKRPDGQNHTDAWLTLPNSVTIPETSVILSRTSRYLYNTPVHNEFYVNLVSQGLGEQGLFIGLPAEHIAFQRQYACTIKRAETENVTAIAALVKGCGIWVGNENFIGSLVEGFKRPAIREISKIYPGSLFCAFRRANLMYI